jgi:hypothetical protein
MIIWCFHLLTFVNDFQLIYPEIWIKHLKENKMNKNQTNSKTLTVLLWIAVLFNMLFADIFSLIVEIVEGNVLDIPLDVTTMMGVAAVITNIPILMIVLSWVLPYKPNKWANIVAASLTILYVIGGGVLLPHYFIIGSVEVILLIIVIIINLRRKP